VRGEKKKKNYKKLEMRILKLLKLFIKSHLLHNRLLHFKNLVKVLRKGKTLKEKFLKIYKLPLWERDLKKNYATFNELFHPHIDIQL
jgi:hypothetical protein